MVSKRKRPATIEADPTPERLLRAGGAVEYGDDRQGRRVLTILDSPLERARARGDLTSGQYDAAKKYYHHWWQAGLADPLQSLDLNRVFGGENAYGMAKTEAQAVHRQHYREANTEIGMIGAAVLDHVVCREKPLADFGFSVGWKSEAKAIEASRETLVQALDKLRRLWGLS